jgi:hypothetical protein
MPDERLLVLQAYGRPRILQEARFAILTFLHFALGRGGWKVVVYTDEPGAFATLGRGVVTEPMDAARLARWRGDIDFVHRVKLEVLLDCAARHPGTLLYVDSDTYFMRDPWALYAQLGDGTALMHECEGRLVERKNGIFRKMHRFVRTHDLPLPSGEVVRMPETTAMWNAGVVGLAPANVPLLRRALALTDVMHRLYPKHVTEQLAVSYVLQNALDLRATDDAIYHYWRSCPEIEPVLAGFFAAHEGMTLPDLAAAAFRLQPKMPPPPPRRRWWQKLLGIRPAPAA